MENPARQILIDVTSWATLAENSRVVKWEAENEGGVTTTKLILKQVMLGHNATLDEENIVSITTVSANGTEENYVLSKLKNGKDRYLMPNLIFYHNVEFQLVTGNGPVFLIGLETTKNDLESKSQVLEVTGDVISQPKIDNEVTGCHCGLNLYSHQPNLQSNPHACLTCSLWIFNWDCYLRHALNCFFKKKIEVSTDKLPVEPTVLPPGTCACGLNKPSHVENNDATADQCLTCGIHIKHGGCYLRHALTCFIRKSVDKEKHKLRPVDLKKPKDNECPCGLNFPSHRLELGEVPLKCSSCSIVIFNGGCFIQHLIRCYLTRFQ